MTQGEQLLSRIKKADKEYYEDDNPSMSDEEYDTLRKEYIRLYGSSDLDYVPGEVSSGFIPFKHPVPVTSLGKWKAGVDSSEELIRKIKELWPVIIEPKYDGLTVVAYPGKNGPRFVTRGSGIEGEILPNFITEYEKQAISSGYAIRGEVFIDSHNFALVNEDLVKSGKEPFKNQRNAAAGILRNKERSKYIDNLSYVLYDLPGIDIAPGEKHDIISHIFNEKDVTLFHQFSTPEETAEMLHEVYDSIIRDGQYPIDGLVIKSCQENSLSKFGYTDHHPKNAFAWKPEALRYESIVRSVEWQVGKGKITPRATIDPVEIAGTTVTHATLDNIGQIREKGLMIGSRVSLIKSGEIIPKIVEVLSEGTEEIDINVCPCCGNKLTEVNGQYFCTNDECDERIARAIAFIAQKDVLDIEGLGIKAAREIVSKFNAEAKQHKQNIIFMLTKKDFLKLSGFADKKADNLYNNVSKSRRDVPFERFIKALCVPMIGKTVGELIGNKYGDIHEFLDNVDYNDLINIKGMGDKTAKILTSESFLNIAEELEGYLHVLPYKSLEAGNEISAVSGKVFVLTGKMPKTRKEYETMIVSAGGNVSGAVSKTTDYLVIADTNSQSSKAIKARSLGTTLISPEDLENMLSENN